MAADEKPEIAVKETGAPAVDLDEGAAEFHFAARWTQPRGRDP